MGKEAVNAATTVEMVEMVATEAMASVVAVAVIMMETLFPSACAAPSRPCPRPRLCAELAWRLPLWELQWFEEYGKTAKAVSGRLLRATGSRAESVLELY